ncbi:hypothetical protein GF420_07880 [candidate division GN15 bacterium]|nr:hypothetical protein [candidate division GN15 bacterium]
MFRFLSATVLLLVLFLTATGIAADKRQARVEKIGDVSRGEIRVSPRLASADTCWVRTDNGIIMQIDGWVIGEELYKSYLDPAESCENPYPFTVVEINMPMVFQAGGQIVVSVDVESVDNSDPSCPVPGQLIDSSSWWDLQVPGAGLYDIWIPLDTPIVVDGPFFAGFLISNQLDQAMGAAVTTDTTRVPCVSYNIWDADMGFVDLGQYIYDDGQVYFEWPGSLVLYASGIPGGNGGGEPEPEPEPAISWVYPAEGDTILYPPAELWAVETSGSSIIDYVIFEYSSGGSFQDLGIVFDGEATKRNGVDPAGVATGYSLPWDFSTMAEGTYTVRVTALDTLGRSASASRQVVLESTPPIPEIVGPNSWETFCEQIQFLVQCSDENVSYVEFRGRAVPDDYSADLYALDQALLGDDDGDPYDGNPVTDGEYGDYYCGPAAAAVAIEKWYTRGYSDLMREGAATLGIAAVAESLAVLFDTRAKAGTRDDFLIAGLKQWTTEHGDAIEVDYRREPDYLTLRTWVQDQERVVLLGLGGDPALWVTVDGFTGWQSGVNTYSVSVMNPLTGAVTGTTLRENAGVTELQLGGVWHSVDIMVSLLAPDWSITRAFLGVDLNGGDGWSFTWNPNPLTEGDWFFFQASTKDATQYPGQSTILMQYSCESQYAAGDYNDDASVDVVDLYYLIQFIAMDGPEPVGGPQRADTNCDSYINVADIVYYMNFLFGSAGPPCN